MSKKKIVQSFVLVARADESEYVVGPFPDITSSRQSHDHLMELGYRVEVRRLWAPNEVAEWPPREFTFAEAAERKAQVATHWRRKEAAKS
jgi:hypothetical protein